MAYAFSDNVIGVPDITAVTLAAGLGDPTGITQLPSVTMETKLGEVRNAWDATLGAGRFIYLAVPTSTAITVGLLYQYDNNYKITLVPIASTSKNTGVPVALAYTAVTSNASSVQYAWFLYQGTAAALKTAVTVSPKSAVYVSSTAGRVKFVSSTGQQLLGARTQNTATVTSTTSSVNIYLMPSMIEGA